MARITPNVPQRGAANNLLNVVDTYYSPARDRVGEAAMSQGFNAASNVASTMTSKLIQRDVEAAQRQAKADAASGLDPDEELTEVRLGNLFRPQSRAYNQVYNEAMGQKAGMEFNQNLTLEYEKSGLKRNTNPEAFRTWVNERVHGFLKDPENQNEYFLAGAVPVVQQQAFNMGSAHMSNISRQMERNHIAAVQSRASEFVMGMVRGERTREEVIEQLSGLNNQAFGTGLTGPTSRRAILSAYLNVADAVDDPEMIPALLAAQESGQLNLTPKEWNSVADQGMGIQRDIEFRMKVQERIDARERKANIDLASEVSADFFSKPANHGVTLSQFLATPVGETGQTMGEMIADSPDSQAMFSAAKTAYTTMNTIHNDIGAVQEGVNDSIITDAFTNGNINNASDLSKFFALKQQDGLRFNESNIEFAFTKLKEHTDPESSYKTQAYQDLARPTTNRIIAALTSEDSVLSTITGEYSGGMSDDIKLRFGAYLSEEFAALPDGQSRNNQAVRKAIEQAEKATMDYYRETDPVMFKDRVDDYMKAVNGDQISINANPYMKEEALRIKEEQLKYDREQDAIIAGEAADETTPFTRTDLEIQKGSSILFEAEAPEAALPSSPQQKAYAAMVEEAEAAQAARAAEKATQDAAEEAQRAADRKAKIDANNALMVEAKNVADRLNEMPLEDVPTVLADIQEEFNLTVPTNYDELKFLAEDLTALQEETGVTINQEVLAKLLKAAMERF